MLTIAACSVQVKPEERLGFTGPDDIRAHPWFEGLDWDALEARAVPAPITPALASPVDASNFDEFSEPPPTPRFPPGQPDPNAAAWADLWDWIEQPPGGGAAPVPLGRRASGSASGLAALRAASLSLATSRPSAGAAETAAPGQSASAASAKAVAPGQSASAVQQAQERLMALQLQTESWKQEPVQSRGDDGDDIALTSSAVQPAEAFASQDAEHTQHADSQQAGREDDGGPDVAASSGMQTSAFAAGSLHTAADGDWGSDSSAGSPVRAVLPPIATSLPVLDSITAGSAGAAELGAHHHQALRGDSAPSPSRPAPVSLPNDLPVYAASADGLVSPLASAGRIDLSGEMSEKGHFVITAGGLVNPAANAGKIVLELDATDTDKFMALESGIVSPTARSGRIILLPEETAKGDAAA